MVKWREKVAAIFVLAVSVLMFMTEPVSAKHTATKIQGCEASDMSFVLSAGGGAQWQAPVVQFAHWRFAHVANLSCTESSCEVASGLRVLPGAAHGDSTATTDGTTEAERIDHKTAIFPSPNAVSDVRRLQGHSAREITKSIRPRAFLGQDRRLHFVWLDYGQINRLISIRGRTEIACSLSGDLCIISTDVLVFIPYNERQRCGYISTGKGHSGLGLVTPKFALAGTHTPTHQHPPPGG